MEYPFPLSNLFHSKSGPHIVGLSPIALTKKIKSSSIGICRAFPTVPSLLEFSLLSSAFVHHSSFVQYLFIFFHPLFVHFTTLHHCISGRSQFRELAKNSINMFYNFVKTKHWIQLRKTRGIGKIRSDFVVTRRLQWEHQSKDCTPMRKGSLYSTNLNPTSRKQE